MRAVSEALWDGYAGNLTNHPRLLAELQLGTGLTDADAAAARKLLVSPHTYRRSRRDRTPNPTAVRLLAIHADYVPWPGWHGSEMHPRLPVPARRTPWLESGRGRGPAVAAGAVAGTAAQITPPSGLWRLLSGSGCRGGVGCRGWLALMALLALAPVVAARAWPASFRSQATWYRDMERLAAAAGCHQAVGLAFTVTDPWEPAFYPTGATGTVEALLFRHGPWLYLLAFDGSPGGHEELPVRAFHQRCESSAGGAPDAS